MRKDRQNPLVTLHCVVDYLRAIIALHQNGRQVQYGILLIQIHPAMTRPPRQVLLM